MSKTVRLKYGSVDIKSFSDGRIMLSVQFYDDVMNRYIWTPAWSQVEQLFLKSVNTEQLNKPRGPWVKQFADTARQVFQDWSADIEEAQLVEGDFVAYQNRSLVIQCEALVDVNANPINLFSSFDRRRSQSWRSKSLARQSHRAFL